MSKNNDYDGAWKEFLDRYFRSFMAFCFPKIAKCIDWTRPFTFMDNELQKVVRDAKLGKLRTDRLVEVYLLNGHESWLLIHIEIQSQPDITLPKRAYVYHHRTEDRYDRPVLTLIVLADTSPNWRPNCYEQEILGCHSSFTFPTVKLLDFPQKTLDQSKDPAAMVIAAHRAAQQTSAKMADRLGMKWQLTRRLYDRGYSKEDILTLFRLIDWLIVLPEDEDIAFRQKLMEYEEEKVMPHITSIERIGMKLGRKEGMRLGKKQGFRLGGQEGELRALREGILEILDLRHKAVPDRLKENINAMSSRDQLKKLLRKAVTVPNLADFEQQMFE